MRNTWNYRRFSFLLALCLLPGLLLSGCGGGSSPAEPAANSDNTAAQAGEEGDPVRVRYICLTKGIPYFDPIIEGMRDAVEAAGGVFQDTAPDQSDATAQIPLVEAAIQERVDVIFVSPSAPDTLNAVFDKARQNGIKVLCVNDDILQNETHRDGAVMSCDYDALAVDSFLQFAEQMNYTGQFAVLSSKTDTPFQNNQIEIYREIMASDDKYAGMELVEVLYGNDEAGKSLTEAEAAIQKYPALVGIISPTTVGVIAAAQAVENAGLSERIVVCGLGTPGQSKAFLQSGTMNGAFLWDTYRTGVVSGELAVALARGEVTLTPGGAFESPSFGAIEILENNVLYAGPPVHITSENADSFKF